MKERLATYLWPFVAASVAYWVIGLPGEGVRICLAIVVGWAYLMHGRHQHLELLYGITDRQLVDTDARLRFAEEKIDRLSLDLEKCCHTHY